MSDLRTEFESIDLNAIDRFVSEHRQEDLHLEFKELPRAPILDRDDQKRLAKGISGFANSDGGIIVWGIESRRADDGIDAAQAKKTIVGVETVLSKLNTLTGQAASPLVDGIEHRAIPERDGQGYVVTYVPRSDVGPHMAKLGEDRYFKRSGSSFYRLEHFDLEDMFGRRPKAILELRHHVSRGPSTLQGGEIAVVIGLANVGRGIARFPFLKLIVPPSWKLDVWGLYGNCGDGLLRRPYVAGLSPPETFSGGADHTIHVGDEVLVTRLVGHVRPSMLPPDLILMYWVGCESALQTGQTLTLFGKQILEELERS